MRLHTWHDGDRQWPAAVWRFPAPVSVLSSAVLGGGWGERDWFVNATVPGDYARTDPWEHAATIADQLGLVGLGVGMLTAVDVRTTRDAVRDGVEVWASVGVTHPTWVVGTINVWAVLPVRLAPEALVNAVGTATEAKAQALRDRGVPGTGTATDAVCVACPVDGPAERFAGPRSVWGQRLSDGVHAAVLAGLP